MRVRATIAASAPILAALILAALAPGLAVAAQAVETTPASGTFSFTTGNGILPTWAAEDIVIVGVSPGSVVTASSNLTARVSLPIIAKTGTANAAAGGFRLINTRTGVNVRCSNPTIDTRARLVDCVLADGTNASIFAIKDIRTRSRVSGSSTITTIFRDVVLRINGQAQADILNKELDTTAFSPYVTVGTGDLIVTRDR
jgi:hypothetical protein